MAKIDGETQESGSYSGSIISQIQNKQPLLSFKCKYPPDMKSKSFIAFILLAIIVAATSCASQKQGCPGNPQASYKFRG